MSPIRFYVFFLLVLPSVLCNISAQTDLASACIALQHSLNLENTTILNATYISVPANVPTPGSCQTYAYVSDPLCRVQFVVNTTSTSSVYAEAWLPDVWYGRFLGLGNGGVGGCIYYNDTRGCHSVTE
ncbi:hypothetical protein FPV67DRAFT_1508889 [Lyophyllum atratum]|nr:hypothetical protein FPV67DRAFT_1508889 [Lyophyllum atratum]